MISSRFFFNGGVIRQNLRQHGWIGILYLAGLLFTLPLQLMMGSPFEKAVRVRDLFEYHGEGQMIFIVSLPVIAGVFITRYIQSRPAADLYHSLPLRRKHLLTAHLTSGLLLLIVPVWMTAAITAFLSNRQEPGYLFTLSDVFFWGISVTVFTLFLYSFTLFVGMCTGQSVFQTVAVYAILLLPMLLGVLLGAHFNLYLYGYPDIGIVVEGGLKYLSPLYHMVGIPEWPYGGFELLIYTALAVLFLVLSYPLYKQRHIESAGQAVAYAFFRPLFKACVILCLMLIAGVYFDTQSNGKAGWTAAGYAFGAVAGYVISEMIIRKTWQIWSRKAAFELAAYGAGIGLLLYGSVSGITGYETRIPAAYSVEAVYMGDYFDIENGEEFSRNPDYIAAVLSLQREIVRMRPPEVSDADRSENYRNVAIAYRLKEGGEVYREYEIPEVQFRDELKTAMEYTDYKKSRYGLYKLNGTSAFAEIYNGISPRHQVKIYNPAETKALELALLQDMEQLSYEEMTSNRIPDTVINIYWDVKGSRYVEQQFQSYQISPSFTHVQSWMSQTGYAKNVQINPEEINMEIIGTGGESLINAVSGLNSLEEEFIRLKEANGGFILENPLIKKQVLEQHRELDFGNEDAVYLIRTTSDGDELYSVLYRKDLTPELEKALAQEL